MSATLPDQRGAALVVVLLATGLLTAVALGLALSSVLARLTGVNHEESIALANASESALELAARELALIEDWDAVLAGTLTSALADGAPGSRVLGGGTSVDLVTLTNHLTCGRPGACTDAQVRAASPERPWRDNNPRWRLFVHTFISPGPLPGTVAPLYVVVWVGDDAAETDGDPLVDGAGIGDEGRYILRARAESFGPRGARFAVEAEFARVCGGEGGCEVRAPGIRVQSWRTVASTAP